MMLVLTMTDCILSLHQLPKFRVDLHYTPHRVAPSSCRGHVDESATEPFLLLHRKHGTGCRRIWNCCNRWTCFVVIWKHFCLILSIGSRIRVTLWCALGLLAGGAIQVPQLQLQFSTISICKWHYAIQCSKCKFWSPGIPCNLRALTIELG